MDVVVALTQVASETHGWWTGPQAGIWIGGVGGSACGLLGGVIGVLGGIGARRGMFRRTVLGLCVAGIAFGIGALAVGLSALLAFGQPYHVWYPLVLVGGILTVVLGINTPVLLGVYREAERRRLEAGLMQPARDGGNASA